MPAISFCDIRNLGGGDRMAAQNGLIGYWPLTGDAIDATGHGGDGRVPESGVEWVNVDRRRGVRISGGHGILVPAGPSQNLGDGDFTIAAWVRTSERLVDVLGDIASKYDPTTRRGLNFGLLNYSGVTSHHPNARNVHFGIDDGSVPRIEDRGRPGSTVFVLALAVHDGELFAGTYAADESDRGHVYRFDGGTSWVDCGAPDGANAVAALAVHDGALYAGTANYKARGSALADSHNTTPGGSVWRYEGVGSWTFCGRLDKDDEYGYPGVAADDIRSETCDTVGMLAAFDGALYAAPWYTEGVFRYDGGTTWSPCGSPGRRLISMTAYDGRLVVAGHDGRPVGVDHADPIAEVFEYGGAGAWQSRGSIPGVTQIYSYAVFGDRLHAGAWPDGRVYQLDGESNWIDQGQLGDEAEVMAMAVYNGRLFAGALPSGSVYSHRDGQGWELVGRLDDTPDVKYRRVWSMAIFEGRLFAGTLPSGRVASIEVGHNVSLDRALPAGWTHLAVTRHRSILELFVNGEQAATSAFTDVVDFSNTAPLRIGAGQHAAFRGLISDLRLYDRAIDHTEIAEIAVSH